jgi:hypothetical protein
MRAWLRRFVLRLQTLLLPGDAERELEREIKAHLDLLEDEYRQRGFSDREAQVAARRALGGVEQTKEIHRDHRSFRWLEDVRRDLPYALRGWRRHPGFTIAAIVTVGLGVGVSTAIFTVVNAILLRPLPYRDSDRLVYLAENIIRQTTSGPQYSQRFGMTQLEFLEWRARSTSFAYMAASANLMSGQLSTPEGPVAAPRALVSPALFEMLGVPAQLGRTLIAEDERADADAAVISAAAWQQFFGSDPSVLGRRITLNSTSFTIVGVMPAGFDYPEPATMFWTPLAPRPGPGTNAFGNTVALLRPGVSVEAATAERMRSATPCDRRRHHRSGSEPLLRRRRHLLRRAAVSLTAPSISRTAHASRCCASKTRLSIPSGRRCTCSQPWCSLFSSSHARTLRTSCSRVVRPDSARSRCASQLAQDADGSCGSC